MTYDPEIHHRRSVRLHGYDYSAGTFFVTICVEGKRNIFGDIVDGEVLLSDAGKIVAEEWINTGKMRPGVTIDRFVVMPNHLHAIIYLYRGALHAPRSGGRTQCAPTVGFDKPPVSSLPLIIRLFKAVTSRRINELLGKSGVKIWQRNYYEHIITSEKSYHEIKRYIDENPLKWEEDPENPSL